MNHVRRSAPLALGAALLTGLTGCGGLVGALVPPVTADNPASLNGARFVGTPFVSVQRVGSNLSIQPTVSFPNGSVDARGLVPQDLELSFSIASLALKDCAPPPGTYSAEVKNVKLTLSEPGASVDLTCPDVTLSFTRAADGSVTVAANRFTATVAGAGVFNIVNGGAQPNSATGTARVESPQDALATCRPELTIGSASATFKNFR